MEGQGEARKRGARGMGTGSGGARSGRESSDGNMRNRNSFALVDEDFPAMGATGATASPTAARVAPLEQHDREKQAQRSDARRQGDNNAAGSRGRGGRGARVSGAGVRADQNPRQYQGRRQEQHEIEQQQEQQQQEQQQQQNHRGIRGESPVYRHSAVSGGDESRESTQHSAPGWRPKMAGIPEKEYGRDENSFPLIGMTARDLDTVVRVHLRQLETQDDYVDDYYLLQFCARNNLSVDDLQVRMAVSSSFSNFVNRARAAALQRASEGAAQPVTDATLKEAHSARNIELLSTALGTLRTWTPKAPRKLVSVSDEGRSADADDAAALSSLNPLAGLASLGGTLEKRRAVLKQNSVALLREDERVRARSLIEAGYDIFAELRDIERGQLTGIVFLKGAVEGHEGDSGLVLASAEELAAQLLFGVLQLDDPVKGGILFLRMSLILKGKRLIGSTIRLHAKLFARLAAVPPNGAAAKSVVRGELQKHIAAITAAVMVNQDLLSHEASAAAAFGERAPDEVVKDIFWTPLEDAVALIESLDMLAAILAAFNMAHEASTVPKLMETAASSDVLNSLMGGISSRFGSSLLCTLLSRAYALLSALSSNKDASAIVAAASWKAAFTPFFDAALAILEPVFARAENTSRIWELAALLDALAEKERQTKLRMTLKPLLEEKRIPPPPSMP
ncbi:hypothetical protein FVE85_6499 [Porphyridium purpureum]|uniref:Uncharacterized protein n=1 Tax=Porphyridium purpureum TaxID=35688 RepID=A0A5J4Z7F6_PORPP|nr:hypothetical protein FVE85_6499 [Porphyridium purpureum]|eukprot:POR6157..scf295_1